MVGAVVWQRCTRIRLRATGTAVDTPRVRISSDWGGGGDHTVSMNTAVAWVVQAGSAGAGRVVGVTSTTAPSTCVVTSGGFAAVADKGSCVQFSAAVHFPVGSRV